MQEPIEDDLVAELRRLRPVGPGKSKTDLWYAAGFAAAQRRARGRHAAAIIVMIGLGSFSLLRPVPKTTTRFVDRVVYIQPAPEPSPPLPSFADAVENRRQMEEALNDRWIDPPIHGDHLPSPTLGAWMTDPDLQAFGGMQ